MARTNPLGTIKDTAIGVARLPLAIAGKAVSTVVGLLPGRPPSSTVAAAPLQEAAPAPAPPRSAPASRSAKPVPVPASAKTGGDPLRASGKKPDLAEPRPAAKRAPARKAAATKAPEPVTQIDAGADVAAVDVTPADVAPAVAKQPEGGEQD